MSKNRRKASKGVETKHIKIEQSLLRKIFAVSYCTMCRCGRKCKIETELSNLIRGNNPPAKNILHDLVIKSLFFCQVVYVRKRRASKFPCSGIQTEGLYIHKRAFIFCKAALFLDEALFLEEVLSLHENRYYLSPSLTNDNMKGSESGYGMAPGAVLIREIIWVVIWWSFRLHQMNSIFNEDILFTDSLTESWLLIVCKSTCFRFEHVLVSISMFSLMEFLYFIPKTTDMM